MSQVSKRPLDKKIYNRIFEIFIASFIEINNKEKAEKFLSELFSKSEQIMIAKRLAIAFLLTNEYSFQAINKMLKVSHATICQVNRFVKKEKSGYLTILKEVEKHKNENPDDTKNPFAYLLATLDTLLDPPRGTDWNKVRKEQYIKLRKLEEENKKAPF